MFSSDSYHDLDVHSFDCLEENECLDLEEPTKFYQSSIMAIDQTLTIPASMPAASTPHPSMMPVHARIKRHKALTHGRRSFKDYTKPIKRGYLNRQIPKNDIRRSLAQVLVRACNDHNPSQLVALLREFCSASVVLTSRYIGNVEHCPVKLSATYRELHGIPHITKYMDALFMAIPDGLIRLLDTKVHMFQNGCSYIVGKFTFQGSKCFDLVTRGDLRGKRCLPSKFDRRTKQTLLCTSLACPDPAPSTATERGAGEPSDDGVDAEYDEDPTYSFHFDMEDHSASLSDLEAILFDDVDNDQDLFSDTTSRTSPLLDTGAARQDKQTMSVALENREIDFVVLHTEWQVSPVPLHFLGTMAFYLDPDARIFKIEILNTIETDKNARLSMKRARHC